MPHVKRTMGQLVKTGTKQIRDAELRRIAVPTALLWGRHDRFVPLGLAAEASTRLGWPLHVIEGAGHAPHIEQPDAFLHALPGALARKPLDRYGGPEGSVVSVGTIDATAAASPDEGA